MYILDSEYNLEKTEFNNYEEALKAAEEEAAMIKHRLTTSEKKRNKKEGCGIFILDSNNIDNSFSDYIDFIPLF